MSLSIRRRRDGSVTVADPPAEHVFAASWLARYLGDLAELQLSIVTEAGPVVYRITGYEPLEGERADGDPKFNPSALLAELVEVPKASKRKAS